TRSSVSKKNSVVTYFTELKMGRSYRLSAWPSAHILIRSMSVQKALDARRHTFQQPIWSQSPRERTSCAEFSTVQQFRFVLFLWEYYSVISPTHRRRYRALWRVQLWT